MSVCMSADCSYLGTVAPAGSFKGWLSCTGVVFMPAWPPSFTGVTGLVLAVLVLTVPFWFCACAVGREENLMLLFLLPISYDTSPVHFCTSLSIWSGLGQTKAQLVQAGNLQFGSWVLPWAEMLNHDGDRWRPADQKHCQSLLQVSELFIWV